MKKIVCIITVFIATAITIYYLRFGGLFGNSSALSTVGLKHHLLFSLWGISTYIALASNIIVAFRTTKYKFYIYLLGTSLIGMILTLGCDFDYSKHSQYMAHCIGSLTFSAIMGILIFILFILKKNITSAIISAIVLVVDLILLIIYKETALIEIVPIFIGYILLLICNLKKEKERIEA